MAAEQDVRVHPLGEGASDPPEPASRSPWRARLLELKTREGASFAERYAGVGFLLALIVFFGIIEPDRFLTYSNFISLIRNESVAGIVALGVLIPLAAGSFDVSIGGTMTLACVFVMWQFQSTEGAMPIPVAILVVLATAVVIGVVNALLVVKAGVEPLIATIGTSTVLTGLSQMIGNGETTTFHIPPNFTTIGRGELAGIPNTLVIFGALALVMWYVLAHTPAGRLLYATGAGREAARLSGVRTDRVIMAAYITSAVAASIAGIVFAARLGSGPPGAGTPYLLPAYATAFLGATIIKPGRFNVAGLVVAMLIIAVGINGLQIMGIPFWVVDLFQGLALITAVLLTKLQGRRR